MNENRLYHLEWQKLEKFTYQIAKSIHSQSVSVNTYVRFKVMSLYSSKIGFPDSSSRNFLMRMEIEMQQGTPTEQFLLRLNRIVSGEDV